MNKGRRLVFTLAACLAFTACKSEQQSLTPAGEGGAADKAGRTATPSTAASNEAPLAIAATDPEVNWGPCPDIFPAGCEITVLHGDPAGPNADVLLRAQPGVYLPPHLHTSAERMILIRGRFQINYGGSKSVTLNAGDYAFGPANLAHDARCLGSEPCILFIAFETPVDAVPVEGPLN